MVVSAKPKPRPRPTSQQEKEFIDNASATKKPATKKPLATTLRFSPEFLAQIDAAAAGRNVTRSAWIKYALSRALEQSQ